MRRLHRHKQVKRRQAVESARLIAEDERLIGVLSEQLRELREAGRGEDDEQVIKLVAALAEMGHDASQEPGE